MAKATDQKLHGMKTTIALEALIEIEKQNNNGKETSLSKIYTLFLENHSLGTKMGEVMSDWVPAAEAVQIFAAERSGRICEGFRQAYKIAKQQAIFIKMFKQALIAPALQLLMAVGILAMAFISLIPTVANTISAEKRSGLSNFVYSMSQTFHWWFAGFLIFIIALIIWLVWALPNLNNSLRLKLENIPPFSIYRIMVGAGFMEAFNALLNSNVTQREALLILEKFAKPYLKYRINRIQELTEQNFGQALISIKLDFPDKEVINELAMASKQGNIAKALPDVVESFQSEGVELIQLQANIANGIARAIVFAVILFLMLSSFTFVIDMAATLN